jgi:hypothetical protein
LAVKPTNAQRDWALPSIVDERPLLAHLTRSAYGRFLAVSAPL